MILEIVTYPAEILRKRAEQVTEITPEIKKLIADMKDTLYEAKGYGLAAPQVGSSIQLLVLDETAGKEGQRPQVFINPVLSDEEGEIVAEEGCLSVPGEYSTCKRFAKLTVNALNERLEPISMVAEGQLARILQHETDHLNGVLFLDRLPSFKRDTIKKHIKRRIQQGEY
ncbi:MAG: peptide deformylase [Deferribacteraceae bacterium]|jgi:peptide deformylase|nr:peptide deformylase [Deferribacteraceae bacterium]